MKRSTCIIAVLVLLPVLLAVHSHAESRGGPWTEEQLWSYSTKVFVGEVLQTTTFPKYRRTLPTRTRVLVSIKGKVQRELRDVEPKHPGKFAYFDAEFDQAVVGRRGVFYVGTEENPGLLMGYKEIPEPGEPAAATPLNTAEAISETLKVADEVRIYRRTSRKEVLLAVMNQSENSSMLQLARQRTSFVQARAASPVLPDGRWLVRAGDSSYAMDYHFENGWLLGSHSKHAAIPDPVKHWLRSLMQKDRRQHNPR